MITVSCPHCDKDIELIGTADIDKEFNITPNMVQHAQSRGLFPAPWLKFANRSIWLRESIAEFDQKRNKKRVEKAAKTISESLAGMTTEEREEMIRLLREQVDTPSQVTARRRRTH